MTSGQVIISKHTLERAVQYFENCKSKTVVKGNKELHSALDVIRTVSQEEGLEPHHITTLLAAAARNCFAQTVCRKLIRLLIPRVHIPQEAVVRAISWISTNKPPLSLQCMLIRWILVVYDYIDGYDKLHCLYGVLFFFLDCQAMLPHICHLLFLLTRKEDVKMFRVRKLLFLIQKRVGPQPCLLGLLTIYKLYYPNLVSFILPSTNKLFFGSFDRKWKSEVRQVMSRSETQRIKDKLGMGSSWTSCLSTSKSQQLATRPPPRKRKRFNVPRSHSAFEECKPNVSMQPLSLSVDANRIPFVQIDTFTNMLDHVDKIEFPSQIAACLQDPLVLHLIAYAADTVVTARLEFWLQHALTEEFFNSVPIEKEGNEHLLKGLIDLTDFLQEGIPAVDRFLSSYLHTWNGLDYCPLIFRLITKYNLYPFQVLSDMLLEPIRKLYFSSSVYFKCQCILALTELLKNYAAYKQPAQTIIDGQTKNQDLPLNIRSVFSENNTSVDLIGVLQNLTSYVDHLAVLGLQLEGDNLLLIYTTLNFIDLLSEWNHHFGVETIILPSDHLVRQILFSSSSIVISRLCKAFYKYREPFMKSFIHLRQSVNIFNDTLVDISDVLWRNKAFCNPSQGSLRVLSSELTSVFSRFAIPYPGSRFSLFQGQAFLPYAWEFLLKTQPEGKKVHPNQLKMVKDTYLEFLHQHHLSGIISFINSFIVRKSLTGHALTSSRD